MSTLHNANPCEMMARIGFAKLLDWPAWPTDEEDPRAIWAATHADHQRVADILRSDAPTEKYGTVRWLGRKLDWPNRLPELVTWSGQQTLAKIIATRQKALGKKPIDNLFSFSAPLSGASGMDPLSADIDARDVGFSANALGMKIIQRPAIELLTIVALEAVPILAMPGKRYAFSVDTVQWEFGVESRAGGYYKRWTYAEVRAVNSHDELVAALRALTDTARTFRNVPESEQQWTSLDDIALEQAFAALSKAEVQS